MSKSVVLAFSGGLDTSFCVPYLREQGYDVITLFVDTGGVDDAERQYIHDRAMALGAMEHVTSSGADAIHPGYGFLSERSDFASAVVEAGLVWIGPPTEAISTMGDKISARIRMIESGDTYVTGAARGGSGTPSRGFRWRA